MTRTPAIVPIYFLVKALLIFGGIYLGVVTKCEHWLLLTILGAAI